MIIRGQHDLFQCNEIEGFTYYSLVKYIHLPGNVNPTFQVDSYLIIFISFLPLLKR